MNDSHLYDCIVIGAGPTGLACAIELARADYDYLAIEKGCLVNSLFHYPSQMTFFTTPELLEIGDLPFVCEREKPTRHEGLKYYRRVAERYNLRVNQYEKVLRVTGSDGDFHLKTEALQNVGGGEFRTYRARKLIVATGYYDFPNYLGIPGEDLPKVAHYYNDAHPFFDRDVVVIGGANSAAIAALELYRHRARVTLVHRGAVLRPSIKYWIMPDITNRIANKEVRALFNTIVTEIKPTSVCVRNLETGEEEEFTNDFVFALTGYHADDDFLLSLGIKLHPETNKPDFDPVTMETNVKGIYLAGVVTAGVDTGKIFIENGRFHGQQIIQALHESLAKQK
ncbi:MAG TPA: YpdA family putative bacillithiol disulfide reductase [Blastocatellia bacterium]|nr:YpdA family putative bacillithiol disulfide reductase [Blastocatellia bacterium]